MRYLVNIFLAIGVAGLGVGCTPEPGEDMGVEMQYVDGQLVPVDSYEPGSAGHAYTQVRQAYDAGDYGEVVSLAKRFERRHEMSPLREDVFFMAAQSELARERYYQAYEFFEKVLEINPGGQYFHQSLQGEFECAQAFMRGERQVIGRIFRIRAEEEAIMIYQAIARHAPGSEMAERALLAVADYYFEEGDYLEAIEAYDAFNESFPHSTHAARTVLAGADCAWLFYAGPEYDETPLLEAMHRYSNFLEQFPNSPQADQVYRRLDEINEARAERIYVQAEFYTRTHEPDSAIYCHELVIERYPHTTWAQRSQAYLGRLEGVPVAPVSQVERTGVRQPVSGGSPTTPPAEVRHTGGPGSVELIGAVGAETSTPE
jgi:outer membrane assembly lipoprotein YfiO